MTAFSDDFNRADGSLGSNWTVPYGTAAIASNRASLDAYAQIRPVTQPTADRIDVTLTLPLTNGTGSVGYIYFAWNGGTTSGYRLSFNPSSWSMQNFLVRYDNNTPTDLHNESNSFAQTSSVDMRVTYDGAFINVYVNEDLVFSEAEDTYAGVSNTFVGAHQFGTIIDAYNQVDLLVADIAVEPDPLWIGGGPVMLTCTGTGTDWTPGVPGSTTITADHGTISEQATLTATSIRFLYTPDEYVGAVEFSESEYGASDIIDTTIVPPEGSGGNVTGLTPYAIAMLNNTAGESLIEILTKPNTPLTVDAETELSVETLLGRVALYTGAKVTPSGIPDAGILDTLWILTNGRYDPVAGPYPTPQTTTLDTALGDILTALDTLITGNDYTLGDVITTLAGVGVPTHKDIRDDIAALPAYDDTDVLAAISALRGAEGSTVEGAITLIQAISTIAGYDLADVLTAIAAIPTNPVTSLSPVTDKLALIQPSTSYSLTSVTDLVTSLTDDVSDVSLELAAVKAIVEGIAAALLATASGPVWPGLANVTLGEPIPLSNGLVVDGPMHGVIVTIDSHPAGAGKYVFGDVTSWTHAGALIFYSDRDDYERAESFGLDSQLINPRTMQEAAGCIVRLTNGWTGTIRTWNRSA